MGRRGKDRPDPVPRRDVASFGNDRHDAGPEAWPGRAAFQAFLQSGLEAIDQDAGRAKAGEFERRRAAKLKYRAQRKAFEVEPDRRDVFAEISGVHFESGRPERIEQFARDEVDLPEVGRLWVPPRQITMPHKRSVMRVTFDALAARQCDRWPRRLAEAMLAVNRHSDHRALRDPVPPFGMLDF